MNGPFQIAQADTSGTGGTKQQPRIVKVTKPYGDQSVVVPLSYDGSVKADLSAIASEKITLVHVGEKLIILFDNHSTITLEPFFDSTGKPLQDLTVEVAPGRDITSAEFATLFPVTDDQSVLPAAGTGNGGGAQASGANFTTVGVDPLGVGQSASFAGPGRIAELSHHQSAGGDIPDDYPTAARTTSLLWMRRISRTRPCRWFGARMRQRIQWDTDARFRFRRSRAGKEGRYQFRCDGREPGPSSGSP